MMIEKIISSMKPKSHMNMDLDGHTTQELSCLYQKKFGMIPKVYLDK